MAKLVRDKIPEIIMNSGRNPLTRLATKEELEQLLKMKVFEEASELKNTNEKEKEVDEIVDILEATYSLAEIKGINLKTLEELRVKKAKDRGSFKKGIVLENVE